MKNIYLETPAEQFVLNHIAGLSDGITCWRDESLVEVRDDSISGRGLFSKVDAFIAKGTLVAVKVGNVISEEIVYELENIIKGTQQELYEFIPDADDSEKFIENLGELLFIAGVTPEEVQLNTVCYNHSCDSNLRVVTWPEQGMAFVIAAKDIGPDSELALDYSLNFTSDTQKLDPCKCGSQLCRKVVSPGNDWKNPNFIFEKIGLFAPHVEERQNRFFGAPNVANPRDLLVSAQISTKEIYDVTAKTSTL